MRKKANRDAEDFGIYPPAKLVGAMTGRQIVALSKELDRDFLDQGRGAVERLLSQASSLATDSNPDAREMRWRIRTISRAMTRGRKVEVFRLIEHAFRLGVLVERALVRPSDNAARAGKRASRGGVTGHEIAHGTPEDKDARWQGYVETFQKHLKSGLGITAAYRKTATEHCVDPKTIQRAVKRICGQSS